MSPEAAAAARARVEGEEVRGLLDRLYQGVAILVGSELDTATSGERGLGRASSSPPRFGGAFRGSLAVEPAAAFGELLERLVIDGFAAGAAYDHLLDDGPSPIRDREPDDVVGFWIPRMYAGLSGASRSILELLDAVGDEDLGRLDELARRHGLVRGLRKGAKREVLSEIGVFLLGAGVDLFLCATSRSDAEFARFVERGF